MTGQTVSQAVTGRTVTAPSRAFIARWDLDKTYLRTDFDTLRDLIRTAIERPDQKRTVPGAAELLRQLGRAGVETHILSGSPEQLRGRIIEKLRLDGVRYASLTLKPNLQNILRLRFRALRGQLGYKLPSLLQKRCELAHGPSSEITREVLFGDDAEADAFVYCLYGDVCSGKVSEAELGALLKRGGCYEDAIEDALRFSRYIQKGEVVERVLIHLDRQSSPSDFVGYGSKVVPFYNYLQAAFVLFEDGRLPPEGVLEVAAHLVVVHHFERTQLCRSYLDLYRRGHLLGSRFGELEDALGPWSEARRTAAASELACMVDELRQQAPMSRRPGPLAPTVDYEALVDHHNPRRKKRGRSSH